MTDSLKVPVQSPGAKEATGELRAYAEQLQKAGVTGEEFERRLRGTRDEYRRYASEIAGAQEKVESFGDRVQKLGDQLRAAKEIAGTFTNAIAGAVRTVTEGAIANERQQRALEQLGSAYGAVTAATRGAVTAQQALKTQQDLVQSGLRVSDQALAAITRTAREFARRAGIDTSQALDQLTGALRNGDAGGLRQFGLSVTGTGNRVRDFNGAIDQMINRQRGVAPAAQSMSEAVDATSRQWDAFKNSVMGAASEVLHLHEVFETLTSAMRAIQRDGFFVSIGEQIANVFDPSGQAASRQRREYDEQQARAQSRNIQQNFAARSGEALADLQRSGLSDRSVTALRSALQGRQFTDQQASQIYSSLTASQFDAQATLELIQGGLSEVERLRREQAQRRTDERAESAAMARRRMASQAEGMAPSDPAVVREMGQQIYSLVQQARRASVTVTELQIRDGENAMRYLERNIRQFEQRFVTAQNRVYRHRFETDDALLQRRIAVVQRELAVVEENERAKREAINETTAAIKAQIEADERAKATAANDQEITRRQRRGQGFQLIRGLGQRATTAGLVQDAEGALGLRGFNPGGASRDTERGALLGRVQSLTEQAANTQDESTAEQLQAQAAAIAEVVGRYDELRRSQQAANDTGLQFAQAFSQHTELVSTSAQTMASVASEAFGTFKNALRQHIGAVLAGKESVGEALRAIAQATLSNLAERSLYEGLFETAKGIGKLAASYGADPTAYGHFAAAAGYFGLAALGGLGAYGLSQMAPQSGGGGSPSTYTDKPASATPANNNSGNGTVVINNTFSGVVVGNSQENVDRWITDAVNRAHRRGDIRAA